MCLLWYEGPLQGRCIANGKRKKATDPMKIGRYDTTNTTPALILRLHEPQNRMDEIVDTCWRGTKVSEWSSRRRRQRMWSKRLVARPTITQAMHEMGGECLHRRRVDMNHRTDQMKLSTRVGRGTKFRSGLVSVDISASCCRRVWMQDQLAQAMHEMGREHLHRSHMNHRTDWMQSSSIETYWWRNKVSQWFCLPRCQRIMLSKRLDRRPTSTQAMHEDGKESRRAYTEAT